MIQLIRCLDLLIIDKFRLSSVSSRHGDSKPMPEERKILNHCRSVSVETVPGIAEAVPAKKINDCCAVKIREIALSKMCIVLKEV